MQESAESASDDDLIDFDKTDIDVTREHAVLTNDEAYKINHSYEQAPAGVTLNLLGCLLFGGWLWNLVPNNLLMPWGIFILANTIVHFFIINQYQRAKDRTQFRKNWAFFNGFLFTVYAIAWGCGYHLFFPYLDPNQQIFLFYLAGIYLLGLLPVLASTHKAYVCVLTALSIPLLLLTLEQPFNEGIITASLIAFTTIALGFIAKRYQQTIQESYLLAMDIKQSSEKLHHEHFKKFSLEYKKRIYEEKTRAEKISQEKDQAVKTLTSIGEAIVTTDKDGNITYMNPVAEIYTGWKHEQALGNHFDRIITIFDESTGQKIDSLLENCVKSSNTITASDDTKLLRRDKVEYFIDYSVSPILDNKQEIVGTVMVFRDITEDRGREKLAWQANHDQLTGLINRREFENRLLKILKSKDEERQHALCYIDLDHFKIVNDTCGHEAGDKLLKMIADCLKNRTRDTDTLARLGGDEFGLILYSCSLKKAELLAEIVRKEVEQIEFKWDGEVYKVSASIGVVAITDQFHSLSDILRSADIACYDAKDDGRNKVNILDFTDEFILHNIEDSPKNETIHSCLNREAFLLFHQGMESVNPEVSDRMSELYIRAEKTNGDLLLPEEIFPVAKRYHLLTSMDRWVVRNSFEALADYDHPLNQFDIININLCRESIRDESFLEYLLLCQNHYALTGSHKKICLDIPESSLEKNPDETRKFIQRAKLNNFLVTIDDFHSSLNNFKRIKSLQVDFIKFDGRELTDSRELEIEQTLIRSLNEVAHQLRVKTIAKQVDTVHSHQTLKNIGIDFIQGNIISAAKALPKPSTDLEQTTAFTIS